jgi:hypothetical protein
LELGLLASGTCAAGPLAPHELVPEHSARLLADDPVDRQALTSLEVAHGGLRQGAKAPVDRPRVLAHPDQPALKRPHSLGALGLAVACPKRDQTGFPSERGFRSRAHDSVYRETLAELKAPHGGPRQRAKAPVDRPRVFAHPDQPALKRPHSLGAVGLCVTRPRADEADPGGRKLRVGLGRRGGRGGRRRDRHDERRRQSRYVGCPLHRFLLLLREFARRTAAAARRDG